MAERDTGIDVDFDSETNDNHIETDAGIKAGIDIEAASDAQLTALGPTGDTRALDELYRRHLDAAWGLAVSIVRNEHDAADVVSESFAKVFARIRSGAYDDTVAFRGYLLVTVRNAAADVYRRRGRESVSDSGSVTDAGGWAPSPARLLMEGADAAMVVTAFNRLPERWQTVLWLTEVEGLPARSVAPTMGLSPNGAAQLAVRARRGLREQYAQAHVRVADRRDCQRVADRLLPYTVDALSDAATRPVTDHLASCGACRDRLAELTEVNSRLQLYALPVEADETADLTESSDVAAARAS